MSNSKIIKVYKELTKDQKARGVIFSSTLSVNKTEGKDGVMHEIVEGQPDEGVQRARLLDDSFFNDSHFNYNVVRR